MTRDEIVAGIDEILSRSDAEHAALSIRRELSDLLDRAG